MTIANGGGRDNDTVATLQRQRGDVRQPEALRDVRRSAIGAARDDRRSRADAGCRIAITLDVELRKRSALAGEATTALRSAACGSRARLRRAAHAPSSASDARSPRADRCSAPRAPASLDHRAARRGQPVEALAPRQLADRPGGFAAGADRRDRREMRAHRVEIERRMRARAGAPRRARCAPRETTASWHDTITPTLTNSSRSTRGTTRITA